jgi:hypothetical protein
VDPDDSMTLKDIYEIKDWWLNVVSSPIYTDLRCWVMM